jgi:hypothetical protein
MQLTAPPVQSFLCFIVRLCEKLTSGHGLTHMCQRVRDVSRARRSRTSLTMYLCVDNNTKERLLSMTGYGLFVALDALRN